MEVKALLQQIMEVREHIVKEAVVVEGITHILLVQIVVVLEQ